MADWISLVLTDAGFNGILKSIARDVPLKYTRAGFGDQKASTDLHDLTELTNERASTHSITQGLAVDTIKITTHLSGDDVLASFVAVQAGIFFDDEGQEKLFAISETQTAGMPIDPGPNLEYYISFIINTANADYVQTIIDASKFIDNSDLWQYTQDFAAPIVHDHVAADITDGLDVFAANKHEHMKADINGIQYAVYGSPNAYYEQSRGGICINLPVKPTEDKYIVICRTNSSFGNRGPMGVFTWCTGEPLPDIVDVFPLMLTDTKQAYMYDISELRGDLYWLYGGGDVLWSCLIDTVNKKAFLVGYREPAGVDEPFYIGLSTGIKTESSKPNTAIITAPGRGGIIHDYDPRDGKLTATMSGWPLNTTLPQAYVPRVEINEWPVQPFVSEFNTFFGMIANIGRADLAYLGHYYKQQTLTAQSTYTNDAHLQEYGFFQFVQQVCITPLKAQSAGFSQSVIVKYSAYPMQEMLPALEIKILHNAGYAQEYYGLNNPRCPVKIISGSGSGTINTDNQTIILMVQTMEDIPENNYSIVTKFKGFVAF